jgi:hypothetical protein
MLNGFKEIMQSIEGLSGNYSDFKFDKDEFLNEYKKGFSFINDIKNFNNAINSKKNIKRKFENELELFEKDISPAELDEINIEIFKMNFDRINNDLINMTPTSMKVNISPEKKKENFKILQEKVCVKLKDKLKLDENSKTYYKFIDLIKQDEKNKIHAKDIEENLNLRIKQELNDNSIVNKIKENLIQLFTDKIDLYADQITNELFDKIRMAIDKEMESNKENRKQIYINLAIKALNKKSEKLDDKKKTIKENSEKN